MFKCSVKIDENLQKEINRKMWIYSLILTIIGLVGLCVYVVLSVKYDNAWTETLLWVMAFSFGFGISFIVSIKKTNKKVSMNNYTDNLEINEEYIFATTTKNEDVISTIKIYYKDLIKIKETERFLVLYVTKINALIIPKNSFNPEEISTIKLWIYSAKKKTS